MSLSHSMSCIFSKWGNSGLCLVVVKSLFSDHMMHWLEVDDVVLSHHRNAPKGGSNRSSSIQYDFGFGRRTSASNQLSYHYNVNTNCKIQTTTTAKYWTTTMVSLITLLWLGFFGYVWPFKDFDLCVNTLFWSRFPFWRLSNLLCFKITWAEKSLNLGYIWRLSCLKSALLQKHNWPYELSDFI